MKQSSWYSIVKLVHKQDHAWHARRWQAERVSQMLTGKMGKATLTDLISAKVTADPGIGEPGGSKVSVGHGGEVTTTKETTLQEMKALRKRMGNCLLLAPLLMHDSNLINARIMLLVGQVAWTEQTWWSVHKTTSAQDRHVSVLNSTGLGESMVMQAWDKAVRQPVELARLGIAVWEGQHQVLDLDIERSEIVARLMSFLLHMIEARLWSALWQEQSMPEMFVGALDPEHQGRVLDHLHRLWVVS